MKLSLFVFTFACLGLIAAPAMALDASGQRYTQMLTSGGPGTITRAAQDIYNTGYTDQETLDVAAQVLNDFYLKNPTARDYADATAWLCKALGNSGNGRYKALLDKVTASDIHRRTRKHCEGAASSLPAGVAEFQPGSVNLDTYRTGATPSTAAPAPAAVAPATQARASDFSQIREGMSMQQVDALLGPPTNQTTYMTGKQFQPFNFAAKDVQRTKYFYKGIGQIVFSLKSAYNGVYQVIEILPNPNESGYP